MPASGYARPTGLTNELQDVGNGELCGAVKKNGATTFLYYRILLPGAKRPMPAPRGVIDQALNANDGDWPRYVIKHRAIVFIPEKKASTQRPPHSASPSPARSGNASPPRLSLQGRAATWTTVQTTHLSGPLPLGANPMATPRRKTMQ